MSSNHSWRPGSTNGDDFELRHWRTLRKQRQQRQQRPLAITIPNGNGNPVNNNGNDHDHDDGGGYVSLRDILTSPEFVHVPSPVTLRGSCPEINIRNPLVKHAAYAYLQPNNSAQGVARRRRLGVRQVCSEIFSPCLEFLGVIFNFRR